MRQPLLEFNHSPLRQGEIACQRLDAFDLVLPDDSLMAALPKPKEAQRAITSGS